MLLNHKCPQCGIIHEMECTPEPDQLCPMCKFMNALTTCSNCGNVIDIRILEKVQGEFGYKFFFCPLCKEPL